MQLCWTDRAFGSVFPDSMELNKALDKVFKFY